MSPSLQGSISSHTKMITPEDVIIQQSSGKRTHQDAFGPQPQPMRPLTNENQLSQTLLGQSGFSEHGDDEKEESKHSEPEQITSIALFNENA